VRCVGDRDGTLPRRRARPDERTRDTILAALKSKLPFVDAAQQARDYLLGKTFTAAHCYAFAGLRWTGRCGIPLDDVPNIRFCLERVAARPKVQDAMQAEGIASWDS
jgi:glutathione S-transferase